MEAVILVGLQASGKSTFCRQYFYDTHVRFNLDMLRTRHRERLLVTACVEGKTRFVVDNTNPAAADRRPYIDAAKAAGFRVVGYYVAASLAVCDARNAARPEGVRVPRLALLGTAKRLERPTLAEGFDALFFVRATADGGFTVEEWRDDV